MWSCCSSWSRGPVAVGVMWSSLGLGSPARLRHGRGGVKAGHAMMRVVRIFRLALATGFLALVAVAPAVRAQEIEPRAYANIPTGLNFVAVGYAYSQGDISVDSSVPLEDASLRI